MFPGVYLDADTAYLLGMLIARGELDTAGSIHRLIVHFPRGALLAQGETLQFDTDREIRLGIEKIRERLAELIGGDINTVETGESVDLVARSSRKTMSWRNIDALLQNRTSFHYFQVPDVFLDPNTPMDYKREFLRGYADVAGNIRPANRDQSGLHRVRLDILNNPGNWKVPVQLCILLQEYLNVPVPIITWGHPNMGREWREHQLNVYAHEFLRVGFHFDYKRRVLEELAKINQSRSFGGTSGCPGQRSLRRVKPPSFDENNTERLDPMLVGFHADAYWQICRQLGCPRRPQPGQQLELVIEEEGDALP